MSTRKHVNHFTVGQQQTTCHNLITILRTPCYSLVLLAKLAFYHLRNISHIRKYISYHTTEILMHAFVKSRLDFCNSLLYGIPQNVPKRLHSVQNAAAGVVTLTGKTEHFTPILEGLHWLPVEQRVIFKIERFSFEYCKTKTKVITLANHKGNRQYSGPIKTRSNYM